jgi:hypothetical protein
MPATLRSWLVMPYPATRPPRRRMKLVDRAVRVGRWPTDKSAAAGLAADHRTTRRDLDYMRYRLHDPMSWDRVHLLIFRAVLGDEGCHVMLRFRSDVARRFAEKLWPARQVLEAQIDGTLIARMQAFEKQVQIEPWCMRWRTFCEVFESRFFVLTNHLL